MKKKSADHEESKSLKTFFLYFVIVLFVILISLGMKAAAIIQASKFDGKHQFIVALGEKGKAKEIVAFQSGETIPVLEIKEDSIPLTALGQRLGIPVDGKINVPENLPAGGSIDDTMANMVWRYNMIATDITLYDILRFLFSAQNTSVTNEIRDTISLSQDDRQINQTIASLFTDQIVSSENVSIQVINATDTPGMGKRLERVLSNIGGNVIAVSTQQKKETNSQIKYYGEESYTLNKIKQFLRYPVTKVNNEPIADITIIIGADSKNTEKF